MKIKKTYIMITKAHVIDEHSDQLVYKTYLDYRYSLVCASVSHRNSKTLVIDSFSYVELCFFSCFVSAGIYASWSTEQQVQ